MHHLTLRSQGVSVSTTRIRSLFSVGSVTSRVMLPSSPCGGGRSDAGVMNPVISGNRSFWGQRGHEIGVVELDDVELGVVIFLSSARLRGRNPDLFPASGCLVSQCPDRRKPRLTHMVWRLNLHVAKIKCSGRRQRS